MPSEALVTFAHISDTHLSQDLTFTLPGRAPYPATESVRALITFLNAFRGPIDFVLHTGDVMHSPQKAADYTVAKAILDECRYPMYFVPGNHDVVEWMQTHLLNRDQVTTNFYSEVEINGVQLVLMDSHAPKNVDSAGGVLGNEQRRWLDSLCTREDKRPMVIAIHHPPLPVLAPWLDRIGLANGLDVHRILRKASHRMRGVFYGHIHHNIVTTRDGVSYYSVDSGWYQTMTWYGQPEGVPGTLRNPGFNLVTITEQEAFVRHIRVP